MYQNYYQPNPQMPTQPRMMPTTPMLKGRPVSSIEEARASSVDFDGTVFYFPDLANKRIYTKHINLDGTASLLMYELKEIPVEQPSFVTREEFENTVNQIKEWFAAAPTSAPPTQTEDPKPVSAQPPSYKF